VRPWQAIRAAGRHHEEDQRVTPLEAFRAHTVGGWRAARDDAAGEVRVGAPAHLAAWRCPTLEGEPGRQLPTLEEEPRLRRLVVAGRTVAKEEDD
jgi:predicted amidohydrolase YtcJ